MRYTKAAKAEVCRGRCVCIRCAQDGGAGVQVWYSSAVLGVKGRWYAVAKRKEGNLKHYS